MLTASRKSQEHVRKEKRGALAAVRERQALQGAAAVTPRRVAQSALIGLAVGDGERSAFMLIREQYPLFLPMKRVTLDSVRVLIHGAACN